MDPLLGLLAVAIVVGAGWAAAVIDDLRWEARSRLQRCMTCGHTHPRHAAHR
ncbi:hypothetical protein [Streptomyces sp. NPDC053367]|uniref:hypothetical protein n=1 Tax=Streptomyces sp. NPDC053367 TaxID=3365700 RepID=UPI0037D688FB